MDKCEAFSRPSDAGLENFPDELLIEIFTYLSVIDLKRVMLASRVFNDVVGQSTKLMRKFTVKIVPNRKWDFESMESFVRKHQNIKLLDFKYEDSFAQLLDGGLPNIGRTVKIFGISDCEISAENFIEILNSMEQLTTVCLTNVKVSLEIPEKLNLPKFRFLTKLNLARSDLPFEIFQWALNLKEIHFEAHDCKALNLANFETLLLRLKRLKSLTLMNIKFCSFLEQRNFPFQLKSLTIQQCHFKAKESIERFLEMQEHLEEVDLTVDSMKIKLDHVRYFDDSLCLILNRKTLKRFSLSIENYNFVNPNFLRQTVNSNVENLKLSLANTSLPVPSILRVFPKINSLELSIKECDEESIEFFNSNLQSLESFKISKFPSESFGKLKLKRLNSLHINETNIQPEHWMEFLENHSNITKLIINFSFFMDLGEDLIDIITKKLKLEHVELIDKWIGMRNEIYLTICENCPNLKYLKLWNINVEKDFDEHDKEHLRSRNIKFHLFNDESLNTPMVPF